MSHPDTVWGWAAPDLTIPEIRKEMHVIADLIDMDPPTADPDRGLRLHQIAEATRRLQHGRRAPRAQGTPDAEQSEEIRQFAAANPDATMFDIGRRFNVNQGRVSEALFGKRKGRNVIEQAAE